MLTFVVFNNNVENRNRLATSYQSGRTARMWYVSAP